MDAPRVFTASRLTSGNLIFPTRIEVTPERLDDPDRLHGKHRPEPRRRSYEGRRDRAARPDPLLPGRPRQLNDPPVRPVRLSPRERPRPAPAAACARPQIRGGAMLKEFKEFAMKGNVLDMAIGVIMGGAFGKIVSSLVGDVLMPPIGKAMGNLDFSSLFFSLDGK